MTRFRVLSVGQCGFDHWRIKRYLEDSFHAQVLGAGAHDEALAALRSERYDLVLVNRVNDSDGTPGCDLIRSLRSDPDLAEVPVMLISDYPDAQEEAEVLGARPGFGKAAMMSETTRERIEAALGSPGTSS